MPLALRLQFLSFGGPCLGNAGIDEGLPSTESVSRQKGKIVYVMCRGHVLAFLVLVDDVGLGKELREREKKLCYQQAARTWVVGTGILTP